MMTVLPQTLINVPVADKAAIADAEEVKAAIAEAEAELGDSGRVLLRPSGTESLVRVPVNAQDTPSASGEVCTVTANDSATPVNPWP